METKEMAVRIRKTLQAPDSEAEATRTQFAAWFAESADGTGPLAHALAEFLRGEMSRAKRCSDIQIEAGLCALFDLAYKLEDTGTTKREKPLLRLAEETETALMLEYATRNSHARVDHGLSDFLHARQKHEPEGESGRVQRLGKALSHQFIEFIHTKPILARLETAVRTCDWSGFFLRTTTTSVPNSFLPRALLLTESGGALAEALRCEARMAQRIAIENHAGAATIAALHMLEAPSATVCLQRPLYLKRLYRRAAEQRRRIVVCREELFDTIWYGETTAKECRDHMEARFEEIFGLTPKQTAAELASKPAKFLLDWHDDPTHGPTVVLRNSNRYQDYIVALLVEGRWNDAEQLLRGTAWTGAYNEEFATRNEGEMPGPDAYVFGLGQRRCLMKLAIVAMQQAMRIPSHLGIAAALGQIILHDCDQFLSKVSSTAWHAAAQFVADREQRRIDRDDPIFCTAVEEILLRITTLAEKAFADMLGTEQPLWLEHLPSDKSYP